jgi:hypothetical protein
MAASTLTSADLHSPVVDAALEGAAHALGTELVFIASLSDEDDTFTFIRAHGSLPGVTVGVPRPRRESMCHYMLGGAPGHTSDACHEPAYATAGVVGELGIVSYVGAPIHIGGKPVGTLCGLDRQPVVMSAAVLQLLHSLARVIGAHVEGAGADEVVVRRSATGWRVGGEEDLDLTSAMTLADLLAESLGPAERPSSGARDTMSELDRLRLAVGQLEYALSARVVVEQAIGVLAERQRLAPRPAFERLRKAARTRGRRVHDLAGEVVASSADRSVPLPPELSPRR